MAEKSGFFNAVLVDGVYDRKYNANDYSDNLAVVISNGVLRSTVNDLKVTASGMVASVAVGRAWINGHYYKNDSVFTFGATSAPVSGKRYDRIMLRLDNQLQARKVSLIYVQGVAAATPTKPAPTRTADVYDLVLADIYIEANGTSITVTDTRSDATLCGWVYSTSGDNSFFTSLDAAFEEWFADKRDELSSVTLFKRYAWSSTLASASSSVSFSIPQYDADTCFLEIYVNGILDRGYTLSNNVITFDGSLIAGTVVTVYCFKSIDGTGIMSVSDEITQLQNQMAAIQGSNKFVYKCTGLNDNISISEIAQAIHAGSYTVGSLSAAAEAFLSNIGGNTYLGSLAVDAQVCIDIVGSLGATTPVYGSGTSASRYRWFNLGIAGTGTSKRLVFDFSKCDKVNIACSNSTSNIILYVRGIDCIIENANIKASNSGSACNIDMVVSAYSQGRQTFEGCKFEVATTGIAGISDNGTFIDCDCLAKSASNEAVCFDVPSNGFVRLIGGTFVTLSGDSSAKSSVMNIITTETNAVIVAQNINCPTVTVSGYTQRHYAIANAGVININGIVTQLASTGSSVTVSNLIQKSK